MGRVRPGDRRAASRAAEAVVGARARHRGRDAVPGLHGARPVERRPAVVLLRLRSVDRTARRRRRVAQPRLPGTDELPLLPDLGPRGVGGPRVPALDAERNLRGDVGQHRVRVVRTSRAAAADQRHRDPRHQPLDPRRQLGDRRTRDRLARPSPGTARRRTGARDRHRAQPRDRDRRRARPLDDRRRRDDAFAGTDAPRRSDPAGRGDAGSRPPASGRGSTDEEELATDIEQTRYAASQGADLAVWREGGLGMDLREREGQRADPQAREGAGDLHRRRLGRHVRRPAPERGRDVLTEGRVPRHVRQVAPGDVRRRLLRPSLRLHRLRDAVRGPRLDHLLRPRLHRLRARRGEGRCERARGVVQRRARDHREALRAPRLPFDRDAPADREGGRTVRLVRDRSVRTDHRPAPVQAAARGPRS